MKKPITHAQMQALAERCETAKTKRCKCRCGGAMHGIAHSHEWIAEEVLRDRTVFQTRASVQVDWIGFSDAERQLRMALPVVRPEESLLSVPG